MADLTITASQVLVGSGAATEDGTAGEAITAGETVYIDSTDSNKIKLASALTSAATATMVGIALNDCASGQPVRYQKLTGNITLGAASGMVVGTPLFLSRVAGKIGALGDLLTGDYVIYIGTPSSTSVCAMAAHVPGIQVP